GNRQIAIDYTAVARPLELAYLFLKMGIKVKKVYLDSVGIDDEDIFNPLIERYPNLILASTMRPECRVIDREESDVVAIGQKAAWFENTPYFVNQIQGGGLVGYEGIIELCDRIMKAMEEKKDLNDIVPRKAQGLCSCAHIY
ncbi:MAG: nitrogenase, partial [Lachnospiraceae bacterium]|nr:nitrogenase [Lachnospiraceae bacterium]